MVFARRQGQQPPNGFPRAYTLRERREPAEEERGDKTKGCGGRAGGRAPALCIAAATLRRPQGELHHRNVFWRAAWIHSSLGPGGLTRYQRCRLPNVLVYLRNHPSCHYPGHPRGSRRSGSTEAGRTASPISATRLLLLVHVCRDHEHAAAAFIFVLCVLHHVFFLFIKLLLTIFCAYILLLLLAPTWTCSCLADRMPKGNSVTNNASELFD